MADLSDTQAAQSVKIVGSDSTGVEQTPVKSSANGDLGVSDISDSGGVHGAVTVTTTATPIRVGGSNLANRKTLTAHNNTTAVINNTLFWGYTSGVTTATGTPLARGQFASWAVGVNTTIYLIAISGSHDVRVTESA